MGVSLHLVREIHQLVNVGAHALLGVCVQLQLLLEESSVEAKVDFDSSRRFGGALIELGTLCDEPDMIRRQGPLPAGGIGCPELQSTSKT